MIANNHSVLENCEALPTGGAEASWIENDLNCEPATPGPKRILIVEDEEPLREWLRMMLELEGHQVIEAGNGAEALNLFTAGHFDLVVTDYQMPVMEGNKLAVAIKLLDPSVPILMITGFARAQRDAHNPVDAMLTKPFRAADLHCALEKLLWAGPQSGRCSIATAPERMSLAQTR